MLHGGDGLELLFLAGVAFVLLGPKDFPILMRKLGQWMGKLRAMAAEFRASFDEMARQSELDELRREVEAMRQGQFADQAARATVGPEATQLFHELGDNLGSGVQFHPPMSHQYEAAGAPLEPAPQPEVEAAAAKEGAPKRVRTTRPKAAKPKDTVVQATAKPVRARAAAAVGAPAKTKAPGKPRAASAPKAKAAAKPAARPAAKRRSPT